MVAVAQRANDELAALTRLTLDELGGAAAGIGRIHKAIADRAFGATGPGAKPARVVHDEVARRVYGGLRLGAAAIGRTAAVAVAGRPPISVAPRGAALIAAIDGLIGDVLEQERPALAAPMSIRVDGEIVGPAELPDHGPQVVVFLHGLMETEFSWGREPYGERLPGWTPVYLRYNTGRHVSENGASLDELMDDLVAQWPVEIERMALVGHSMGGLVARSACHQAALRDAGWVKHVRHVVSLGTPHMGAPLEQSVHYLSAVLSALPETRPFGTFFRRRSSGIRDLRQGSLVDADWRDCDRDALLRLGDDHARADPSGRPAARRLPGARAVGIGAQPHAPAGLPRRGRPARRRGEPLRAAAPSTGLRAAEDLARIAFSAG
jgi:pimeloyl-ACP methyl ester carboxylesterase